MPGFLPTRNAAPEGPIQNAMGGSEYAPRRRLHGNRVAAVRASGASGPSSLAFSRDGKRLAIGYDDDPDAKRLLRSRPYRRQGVARRSTRPGQGRYAGTSIESVDDIKLGFYVAWRVEELAKQYNHDQSSSFKISAEDARRFPIGQPP